MVLPLEELIPQLHIGDVVRVGRTDPGEGHIYFAGYLRRIDVDNGAGPGLELGVFQPLPDTMQLKDDSYILYSDIESYDIMIPKQKGTQ